RGGCTESQGKGRTIKRRDSTDNQCPAMTQRWRRRRDSNVADPNQPPPNEPNEPAPNAAPTGGQPIIVKVDIPERFHRKPATEPWLYGGNFSEDLRAWLLACEDFFNWNPTEWEMETDCIKYAVGRTKIIPKLTTLELVIVDRWRESMGTR